MAHPNPVLLVGGNSGIGLASARLLMSKNQKLVAAARNPEPLESLGIPTVPFDAETPNLEASSLPAKLSGLVYFPGSISLKPFHRLTAVDFQRDLQINLFGAIHAIQGALPALTNGGGASIVLFSSIAATQGMPFHTSIAAAKAALEGMARSLAAELAPSIRVNLIAPSLTDTPLADSLLNSDTKRAMSAKRHPLHQVGDPEDMAELVSFLISDTSKFISGQTFRPDGGLSSIRLFS
ncbi:SDR family NAD(P)-dependent oxidoreductase [Haloferula sp.]|uniref:SDR family NAD(P)-dependent oxidoreductase n=1 Tax=Haloferula sp. TaxID=2497595 RepID=UPI0032A142EB